MDLERTTLNLVIEINTNPRVDLAVANAEEVIPLYLLCHPMMMSKLSKKREKESRRRVASFPEVIKMTPIAVVMVNPIPHQVMEAPTEMTTLTVVPTKMTTLTVVPTEMTTPTVALAEMTTPTEALAETITLMEALVEMTILTAVLVEMIILTAAPVEMITLTAAPVEMITLMAVLVEMTILMAALAETITLMALETDISLFYSTSHILNNLFKCIHMKSI